MTFVETKFEQVEKEWRNLYNDSQFISPYMSYDFQKEYKKKLWTSRKTFFSKYIVYKAYENENLIAIIPLLKIKDKIYIAGDFRATGYLDFIYSDNITDVELDNLVKSFLTFMKDRELHFNKINQTSRLYKILNEITQSKKLNVSQKTCVNIAFGKHYDEYFSKLSKSTRQNIRTAHNRLNREGKSILVETYIGRKIGKEENKNLMKLYQKRSNERSGKTNIIVKTFQTLLNPLTRSLNVNENNFISILKIDSEIAAYMHGFISNHDKAAVIPRLAINSTFNVYCPGGLLITDTIKWLIDNSSVKNLDLSRGDETYKYVYGGTEHYNFDFTVNKSK